MGTGRSVRIHGLGVSGSYLAWRLSSEGISVRAFDPANAYSKPCGDAVTLRPWIRRLLEETSVIKTYVKRFIIRVNGSMITEHKASEPYWAIVDKHNIISYFRREAVRNGLKIIRKSPKLEPRRQDEIAVVDARGPYAHPRESWVYAYRVLARTAKWHADTAILDFYPSRGGLYWLFPADSEGTLINYGAGFLSSAPSAARSFAFEKVKVDIHDPVTPIDERAAPIAVLSNIVVADRGIVRVGEASGLVISSAGEGNRPGLESARLLAEAVLASGDPGALEKRYRRNVSQLVSEARLSRSLLRAAARMGDRFSRFAGSLPESFWENYLQGRISLRYLLSLALQKPSLIKYLL